MVFLGGRNQTDSRTYFINLTFDHKGGVRLTEQQLQRLICAACALYYPEKDASARLLERIIAALDAAK